MAVLPVSLNRDDSSACLVVRWNDGLEQRIPFRLLRERCPCAGCRTPGEETDTPAAGGLRILSPAETRPLDIVAMSPIGNYAYHIEFSDEHNTGIFTFDLLRSLTDESPPTD